MKPEEFVSFFTDPKSKVGPWCVFFEMCYTTMVILMTIFVIAQAHVNAESSSGNSNPCANWESASIVTTTGTLSTFVCTDLQKNSLVPPGIKMAAVIIFMIYLTVQYVNLLIFNSFKTHFYEGGIIGKLIFDTFYFSKVIQTVCVVSFGLTLVYYSNSPNEAILNSTAAVFLGETDDLLLGLVVQGKLRKKNRTEEVEVEVFGITVECPINFLSVSLKEHIQQLHGTVQSGVQGIAGGVVSVGSTVKNTLFEIDNIATYNKHLNDNDKTES